MTEKQVKYFLSLNEKFIDRCSKVCWLLRPLDDSFGCLDTFEPDGKFVYGEGDEYTTLYSITRVELVDALFDMVVKTKEEE